MPKCHSVGDIGEVRCKAHHERLKFLKDDFREPLGRRDGTHEDNEMIDLAIFVEVHLIDRLKLLALELTLKAKKVPIVPCISR